MKEIDKSPHITKDVIERVHDVTSDSPLRKVSLEKDAVRDLKKLEKEVNFGTGEFKRFEPDYSPAKPSPKVKIVKQKKREFFRK